MNEISIKVVSENARRGTAMVVLHQVNPKNPSQNVTETRHLKFKGGRWQDKAGNIFVEKDGEFRLTDVSS